MDELQRIYHKLYLALLVCQLDLSPLPPRTPASLAHPAPVHYKMPFSTRW